MKHIVVLGGGISGLSSAFFLSRALPNAQILLLERSIRAGGWISSDPLPIGPDAGNSVVVESGPRSLRPRGYAGAITLKLINDLGCIDELLTVSKSASSAQKRYVLNGDHMSLLPSSLRSFMSANASPISPLYGVLRQILSEPFKRHVLAKDESVNSFLSRRLSSSLADNLVSAVFHGIYAGDIRQLSVRSTMPLLPELEDRFGSVIMGGLLGGMFPSERQQKDSAKLNILLATNKKLHGIWKDMSDVSIYSMTGGLESLVKRLFKTLESTSNVMILLNTKIQSAGFNDTAIKLTTTDGDVIKTDHLVAAIPAPALASLLQTSTNINSTVVERLLTLLQIPSVDVSVTNVIFATNSLSQQTLALSNGFGMLSPLNRSPDTDPLLLGIIFDSNALPGLDPSGTAFTKFTVMMGGHLFNHSSFTSNNNDLKSRAVQSVRHHLNISNNVQPVLVKSQLQSQCIPQYHVGHQQQMQLLRHEMLTHLPHRISLAGSWYGAGVGVNDCVKNSWEIATAIAHSSQDIHARPVLGI